VLRPRGRSLSSSRAPTSARTSATRSTGAVSSSAAVTWRSPISSTIRSGSATGITGLRTPTGGGHGAQYCPKLPRRWELATDAPDSQRAAAKLPSTRLHVGPTGYGRRVAELDYAYLADAVRVEQNGIMNALGMSYTHVAVSALPIAHPVVAAGRAWLDTNESYVELTLIAEGPRDTFSISTSQLLHVLPGEPEMDGRRSVSFAIHFVLPVTAEGRYGFRLVLDDAEVKTLAFVVELDSGP